MNIRSLSKYAGKLLAFLSNLPEFDVLVLTEIGVWNIEVAVNHFSTYTFNYILPQKNSYGGVGIFINNYVSNISFRSNVVNRTCRCSKCDFESLLVDFTFANIKYTLLGAYRHPNGNVLHFNDDVENCIINIEKDRTALFIGDINVDIIKQDDEATLSYYTMFLSNNFKN